MGVVSSLKDISIKKETYQPKQENVSGLKK